MSEIASARGKKVLIGVLAVAVIGVAVFALTRINHDKTKPLATNTDTTATSSGPTTTEPTTAKPKSTGPATCDGPNTKDNLSGKEQDSLLPDCGAPVVTQQQQKTGLGLGCGGTYPVILYKTTTSGAKTSICGKTSSGESFHFVTQPTGGAVIDVPGSYDPQQDAFIGRHDGTTYSVLAYDGTLVVTKGGKSTKQKSNDDWISLDNESDYD